MSCVSNLNRAANSLQGISRTRKKDLADLVRVLHGNSYKQGKFSGFCCFKVSILCEKLNWSETKFHEVKRLAIAIGWITVQSRIPHDGGQQANAWKVNWQEIEKLAPSKPRTEPPSRPQKTQQGGVRNPTGGGAESANVLIDARTRAKTKEPKERINTIVGVCDNGNGKAASPKPTGKTVRWPKPITASDLRDDRMIFALCGEAAKQGVVKRTQQSIRDFFVFAEVAAGAKNPPGIFTMFVNGTNKFPIPDWAEDQGVARYKRASGQAQERRKPKHVPTYETDERFWEMPKSVGSVVADILKRKQG